jgi:DNA repair exonuclease SbcCD nuclease subunit
MSVKLRFVHAADLHLDSPFHCLQGSGGEIGSLLREATFTTFERILNLCRRRQADFLLIAGDVFDSADRGLRAQLRFRDGLGGLATDGIQSFVVHGNHDPLDGWAATLDWPKGIHVFRDPNLPKAVAIKKNGLELARVYGRSFPRRDVRSNLALDFRRGGEGFAIGLLHCNVGENTGHEPYAPCSLQDLAAAGFDYWALGHVHTRAVLSTRAPTVVYPGNPQGRNLLEAGPRGCYVVEVDQDHQVHVEFVAVDAVRWETVQIGIAQMASEQELLDALFATIRDLRARSGRPVIARLRLEGRGPLHATLQRNQVLDDLLAETRSAGNADQPLVWLERIEDRTQPPVDLTLRRQAGDFLGELLRLAEAHRSEPERREQLTRVLTRLYGAPRAEKLLCFPAEGELMELLDQATAHCVDLLEAD